VYRFLAGPTAAGGTRSRGQQDIIGATMRVHFQHRWDLVLHQAQAANHECRPVAGSVGLVLADLLFRGPPGALPNVCAVRHRCLLPDSGQKPCASHGRTSPERTGWSAARGCGGGDTAAAYNCSGRAVQPSQHGEAVTAWSGCHSCGCRRLLGHCAGPAHRNWSRRAAVSNDRRAPAANRVAGRVHVHVLASIELPTDKSDAKTALRGSAFRGQLSIMHADGSVQRFATLERPKLLFTDQSMPHTPTHLIKGAISVWLHGSDPCAVCGPPEGVHCSHCKQQEGID
jgi:hypothetical protein